MSNNPNFVSELVQMARAFEELPQVQANLDTALAQVAAQQDTIQRLELKLLDRANELDAAHAATQKAEVERDHAETMFLETDDKLNALRRIFTHFKAEVDTFIEANEPEPVATPETQPLPPQEVNSAQPESATAPADDGIKSNPAEVPQVPTDPTAITSTQADVTSPSGDATSSGAESTASVSTAHSDAPEVAAQPDPTTAPTATSSSDLGTPPVPAIDASVATSSLTDAPGYHNEPERYSPEWSSWAIKMDDRYGVGFWPERFDAPPQAAAQ